LDYSGSIFIYIPKPYNPHKKVEVITDSGTDDVTGRVVTLKFNKPLINYYGVGKFKITILNNDEYYTGRYSSGDKVKIYLDHSDATTQQFYGVIKSVVGVFKDNYGNVIEIEGVHIGKDIVEKNITAEVENVETSNVIKNIIIGGKLTNFTSNNVNASSVSVSVSWSYKNISEAISYLCKKAGFDAYVDDNLDIHYFQSGSIIQSSDAAVFSKYGNVVEVPKFGEDTRDNVGITTVIGEDDSGMMIISTHGSSGREKVIKSTNVKTSTQAEEYASSYVDETKDVGKVKVLGVENVLPGDMLYINIPFMNISSRYKVINIEHSIGEDGIWLSAIEFVKKTDTMQNFLKERLDAESESGNIINPHDMKDSYVLSFMDSSNIDSMSSVIIEESVAKIEPGYSNGIIISSPKTFSRQFSYLEFRKKGEDLDDSRFYYKVDDGDWNEITSFNALISASGSKIAIKIELNSTSSSPSPKIDSFGVYVK